MDHKCPYLHQIGVIKCPSRNRAPSFAAGLNLTHIKDHETPAQQFWYREIAFIDPKACYLLVSFLTLYIYFYLCFHESLHSYKYKQKPKTMSFFFRKYNHFTKTRPLATNIATTGFLFGAGDFLAQQLELRQAGPTHAGSTYDYQRTARAVAYGSAVFGPLAGKWFGYLLHVTVGSSAAANTVARVALDQCVFAPLVGIPLYFSCMTAMEAPPDVRGAIAAKLHNTWWDTVWANWMVWPAVQLANFGFVPAQFRLLAVNVVSIGWNCYLLMENSEK